MSDLFFTKPLCLCNLDYGIAWFFFVLGNGFFWGMIWINPINIVYGKDVNTIKFTFSCASFFIISLLPRIMCKPNARYIDLEEHTNYKTYGIHD